MTERDAAQWLASAPKEAIAYVRTAAAAWLAQRGAIYEPIKYDAAASDALCMAVALAMKFWSADDPHERK